jgi:hypothetical protein
VRTLVLLAMMAAATASAQEVPLRIALLHDVAAPQQAAPPGHTPTGALWRSLAVPGWGQLYNRQPVRAAVAAGAVGGMAALTLVINGRYRLYQRAFLYIAFEPDPAQPDPEHPFPQYRDDWLSTGARPAGSPRVVRDNLRRNRDFAVLGTVAVYSLQALEALVSGHLIDFDVSEDLSLHLEPTPEGASATLRLRF